MIIIKIGTKIKDINQKSYTNTVNSIDFSKISCSCGATNSFKTHSYYVRNVSFLGLKIKIRIMRVICADCGRTHAILIESMVPFSILSKDDIVSIIVNNNHYDPSYLSYLRRSFDITLSYEDLCIIKSRKFDCIFITT